MDILRISLDLPNMSYEELINQTIPSILLFFSKLLESECYF